MPLRGARRRVGRGRFVLTLTILSSLAPSVDLSSPRSVADRFGARLAAAARAQVGVTLHYDGAYRLMRYPGGDVSRERGVCTDVVVRAYRRLGVDLQVLVHEDMRRAWADYPKRWGLDRPDPNIDHRRVANLRVFFGRHGRSLPVTSRGSDYEAGDLVTWRLPSGHPHVGIVSDEGRAGRPLIIHHLKRGVRIEDILFAYRVTGHYRFEVPGTDEQGRQPEGSEER